MLIVAISLTILSGVAGERIYGQQIGSAVFFARLVNFIIVQFCSDIKYTRIYEVHLQFQN